jgi:hypothetical protein
MFEKEDKRDRKTSEKKDNQERICHRNKETQNPR